MRSTFLAASALLVGGVVSAPAPAPVPVPAPAGQPITIPIHRRSQGQKKDLASFERAVKHMKGRYGVKTAASEKEKRAGSVTLTNFQDS